MKKSNRKRYALAAVLALVVATSSFAFAASNTVNASRAGDGKGAVAGYTVTPTWTLNSTDPSTGPTANISLSSSAGTGNVYVRALDASDAAIGGWVACTGATGTAFTCAFPSTVTVASIEQLQVAAAS